jgi:hypothetical protein
MVPAATSAAPDPRPGRSASPRDLQAVQRDGQIDAAHPDATRDDGRVVVDAGAVAYRGRGIVLPCWDAVFKRELTAAPVEAGACFYSDETAVIDVNGLLSWKLDGLQRGDPDREVVVVRRALRSASPLALIARHGVCRGSRDGRRCGRGRARNATHSRVAVVAPCTSRFSANTPNARSEPDRSCRFCLVQCATPSI